MKSIHLVSALVLLLGSPAPAQEARFRPEDSFPADSIAYLHVASVERLGVGLESTLIGRIASHPGIRAALGTLPDLLRQMRQERTRAFSEATGKDLLEALVLPRGEVAAVFAGLAPSGEPRIALAIELGPTREAILDLFQKLDRTAEELGVARESAQLGERPAVIWRAPGGPVIARAVAGTHLVLATPPELLASIVKAHGQAGGPALKAAPFLSGLRPRLDLARGEALIALDLARIRDLVRRSLGEGPEREKLDRFLDASGLGGAAAMGGALGFRDGGMEVLLHLATPGGSRGALGVLAGCFQAVEGLDDALRMVPRDATAVYAVGIQPGKLIREGLALLKTVLPELAAPVEEAVRGVEARFGISLSEAAELPPWKVLGFNITPPAGSLFEDSIGFVRSRDFEQYRRLLDRSLKAVGGSIRTIEDSGKRISYFAYFAWVPLDDGWTAVSGSVTALRRHVRHYRSAEKVSQSPELHRSWREMLSGAAGGAVLRGERSLLSAYNTVVSLLNLAAPPFEAYLAPLGVDPGLLPPGEEFLAGVRDGFIRFQAGPDGFTLHGHRVVTGSGVLSVVAVGSVAAGFLVPTLLKARERADLVRCQSNLREIQKLGLIYADSAGNRFYPYSREGGVASLRVLAESFEEARPELFICPRSTFKPAEADAGGKFRLDERHSSYEMVPRRLSPSDRADTILLYDRAPHHGGRRNVVFLDGSVEMMPEAEFQERLVKQLKAVETRPPGKEPAEKKPAQRKKRKAP